MADRVTQDDLFVAIEWLRANESDTDAERQGCQRVAGMLRQTLAHRLVDGVVRTNFPKGTKLTSAQRMKIETALVAERALPDAEEIA